MFFFRIKKLNCKSDSIYLPSYCKSSAEWKDLEGKTNGQTDRQTNTHTKKFLVAKKTTRVVFKAQDEDVSLDRSLVTQLYAIVYLTTHLCFGSQCRSKDSSSSSSSSSSLKSLFLLNSVLGWSPPS